MNSWNISVNDGKDYEKYKQGGINEEVHINPSSFVLYSVKIEAIEETCNVLHKMVT